MTTRILVADDDPVQRRLLDAMIRRFGYEPVTVDGGEAAMLLHRNASATLGSSRPAAMRRKAVTRRRCSGLRYWRPFSSILST